MNESWQTCAQVLPKNFRKFVNTISCGRRVVSDFVLGYSILSRPQYSAVTIWLTQKSAGFGLVFVARSRELENRPDPCLDIKGT